MLASRLGRIYPAVAGTAARHVLASLSLGAPSGNRRAPRTYAHCCSCLGQGFGPHYPWVRTLEEGLEISAKQNKPLLVIVHKSWCSTSLDLAHHICRNPEMIRLGNYFIMVNLLDDDEPRDKKYMPDGGYTPRVLFVSPSGEVRQDIYNRGGLEKFKFFYPDACSITKSMREALKQMSPMLYAQEIKHM